MAKGKKHKDEARPQDPRAEETTRSGGPDASPSDADTAGDVDREGEGVHDRLAELEEEIQRVQGEAAEASDRALRVLAEFDNFRRRSHREREAAASLGASDVLRELLDVADNFDRAMEHAGDDVPAPFLEGMQLVARGLHDLLDRRGVERMDAEGQPFDPERHEALTRQPSEDVPPNTVVQVVQAGYLVGDRVLRPAKVIVSAPAPSAVDAPVGDGNGETE